MGLEYTSLSNLSQYDVDYIGIHKSLIEDILESERTQNMIQGLIDFCKKIEVETIVDGIDSQEKADLLKKLGVAGNRVRMELKDGEIIIRKPLEEETR